MNFNDLDWHDAIVKNIVIDRNNPGIKDFIKLEVQIKDQILCCFFKDVYWAELHMNFGIVAEESIMEAYVDSDQSLEIMNLRTKWKGFLDNIDLYSYVLRFNSTDSSMKIISKSFYVTIFR